MDEENSHITVYLGTHNSMIFHAHEHGYNPHKIVWVYDSSTLHGHRDVDVLFCKTWRELPIKQRDGVLHQLSIIGTNSWKDVC